jgi:hypothetical protein
MFCEKNAGQSCNIKTAGESFGNVAEFKYLETTPQRGDSQYTAPHGMTPHDMT